MSNTNKGQWLESPPAPIKNKDIITTENILEHNHLLDELYEKLSNIQIFGPPNYKNYTSINTKTNYQAPANGWVYVDARSPTTISGKASCSITIDNFKHSFSTGWFGHAKCRLFPVKKGSKIYITGGSKRYFFYCRSDF